MNPELAARAAALRPSKVRELVAAAGRRPLLALSGGLPPPEAFPFEAIAEVTAELLRDRDATALQYSASEGDGELRELLGGDGVLVTTGSQQALDLLGKVLLDRGDAVVVECPSYVGALRALAPYEPEFVSVPVDDEGLDTDELAARLAAGLRPKCCYVVSNFSNPSGATLSAARRAQLVELAAQYGFLIVEDDPYGQLRFAGTDVASMASLDDGVLYLGSFSKTIAPGLRVGYAQVPSWLWTPMLLAKQAADLSTSSFGQRVVVALLQRDGWLDTHLTQVRGIYRDRADALLDALDPRFDVRRPEGGMFAWAALTVDVAAEALSDACMARDVAIVPGAEFALVPGYERTVRLSFSQLSPDDLREAAARITDALDALT